MYRSPDYIVSLPVLELSFCAMVANTPLIYPEMRDTVQIALGAFMCLLIVIQFIREARRMYKATKHFRLNCYMNVPVRHLVLSFIFEPMANYDE